MTAQRGAERLPWINRGLVGIVRFVVDVLCVVLMIFVGYMILVVGAGYDRAIAELQRRDAALEKRVEALESQAVGRPGPRE